MKYTIRNIPEPVDSAIRSRARAMGKSLNETVVYVLSVGAGVADTPRRRRDLTDIAGSWKPRKSVQV